MPATAQESVSNSGILLLSEIRTELREQTIVLKRANSKLWKILEALKTEDETVDSRGEE